MGFRFRKSINLGGGVRLNLSKRGLGVSVGTKGFRISTSSSGSRMTTSIPGTGLYYEKKLGSKKNRSSWERQLELQQKQQQKLMQFEAAKLEVELYENKIELLQSVHKECSEPIDWESIINSSPPFPKGKIGPNEQEAMLKLKNYKPTWRDKLFNRVEVKKKELEKKIYEAKQMDLDEYKEWENSVNLAKRIINGDLNAYIDVINKLAPFDDIEELGSSYDIHVINKDIIEFYLNVHSEKIIPSETKSLTKTGKVSTRPMAKSKYFELYQDFVCSCVLRVARELFALLPIKQTLIHAISEGINTATGHNEKFTILSVKMNRSEIETINFDNIDCSVAIENFEHNMKFRKTKGFAPVEKLSIEVE